eukprot:6213034-Pleurochrysis_carterae.AAC.4
MARSFHYRLALRQQGSAGKIGTAVYALCASVLVAVGGVGIGEGCGGDIGSAGTGSGCVGIACVGGGDIGIDGVGVGIGVGDIRGIGVHIEGAL